jgi:hypothetical protein
MASSAVLEHFKICQENKTLCKLKAKVIEKTDNLRSCPETETNI